MTQFTRDMKSIEWCICIYLIGALVGGVQLHELIGAERPSAGAWLCFVIWMLGNLGFGICFWLPILHEAADRIVFTSQGVYVTRLGRKKQQLLWENVREVGFRQWDNPLAPGISRGHGLYVYIYFAPVVLGDRDRMKIGTDSQYRMSKKNVIYLYCSGFPNPVSDEKCMLNSRILANIPAPLLCNANLVYLPVDNPCMYFTDGRGSYIYNTQQVSQYSSFLGRSHLLLTLSTWWVTLGGFAALVIILENIQHTYWM